jgi:hypothetical protein
MKFTVRLYTLSVVALSSAVMNCGGPTADDAAGGEVTTSRIHIMPLHNPSDPPPSEDRQSQASKTLKNYGGPVLKNVQVYPIDWGGSAGIRCSSNIDSGYTTIVASSIYTSLLTQYSSIGAGTNHATYSDTGAPTATSLTDAQIQAELTRLINAGAVPQPGANNYYPIHFPSGRKITGSDGSQSCVQFCAYHGTYTLNGVNVNYGVIPDVGDTGCAGGCGASTQCNNTTSVMSHELVEATTDPAVGLATVYGPPLAWYNATYGEIGDECNAQQATVSGITVQKEWSNRSNSCNTQ